MDHLNLDLFVERVEQGYRVSVRSPLGYETSDVPSPLDDLNMEHFLDEIGRGNRGATRDLDPRDRPAQIELRSAATRVGTRLFEILFSGEIRAMLKGMQVEAENQGAAGVRLRLHLTGAPELAQLPWEFLHRPRRQGGAFLARQSDTPLVRYLRLPQRVETRTVTPPFRVLVAIACPARYVQLNAHTEWRQLKETLTIGDRARLFKVDLLEDATARGLLRRLRRTDYHILHFIGHGDFDQELEEGFLVMEDEAHLAMDVLGMLLREERRNLRLVILNACKGARSSPGDPFNGLAQSLMSEGIPAVIAMQFAISDKAAIAFAREFYLALAEGEPVDASLALARQGMVVDGHELEWGTPVLFMRSSHARIFEIGEPDRRVGLDVAVPEERVFPELRTPRCVKYFVDRDEQIKRFKEMISPEAEERVMFVEAPAEMGKTWLIRWMRHWCLKEGIPVTWIDFEVGAWDHIAIMMDAHSQFGKEHFPRTTEFAGAHRGFGVSATGDIESVRMPHSRAAKDFLERQLMGAFFEDLSELASGDPIALLIDSYEVLLKEDVTSKLARDWLRGPLLTRIRDDRLRSLVLVLAGRQVPQLRSSWEDEIAKTDLACFNDTHWARYLELEGVSGSVQPPQSSALCTDGGYVPGEFRTEIARLKVDWR